MSTKKREVIWGGRIMGADMRAQTARQEASKAARAADRAEAELPDQPFYDAITNFVRSLDVAYFGRGEIKAHAVRIRSGLATHLMETGSRYVDPCVS